MADILTQALQAQGRLSRRASVLSLLGPLLWLVQAWVLASAVVALMDGGQAWPQALAFLALAALRAGVEALALRQTQALSAALRRDLRERLLSHALRLSPRGPEDPGGLASLMGEGIGQISPWVERLRPALLRVRVLPLVILGLVLWHSWAAALALVVTGPLIPVFMALVGAAAETVAKAQLVEQGALNRMLIDRMAALTDLRLMNALPRAEADLATRADSLRARIMAVLRLAFLSSAVLEFFAALGVAMVAVQVGLSLLGLISWGGWGGGITPFGGIFTLLIAPEFFQPLRDMAAAWHDRAAATSAGEAIAARLAEGPTILGAGGMAKAQGGLRWRGLTLPDGAVAPGECVALMGPSGSGKTTALWALAGLIPGGEVWRGETPLTEATADAHRAGLALIPQVPRFPAMALGEWLGGPPDPRLDLGPVIAALPQGLATVLGEGGGGVSGGEARRLMVARALNRRPAVLLADEPTADLDPERARAVGQALCDLARGGAAVLVATHDAELAARVDRVIRL
ncbi:ATP-binding cassette domain-containing protein [Stagnihabitans tardus]|uniref:ATP-binding cassette domain-containing protein n=1 Tax=Stagnihabitans tardus TaxID=2699202 RepID=A0AAE4YGT5_9RHOB|nr:ATP-binding cassette domain-containing protein [Stagnihabitans tardus]NBZ89490.1 ATP-binding cassette domain-containing protein [Stagnihabitans tardus]